MRITAQKQCDAWEPVSRGEVPLAGKRALFPGQTYTLAEGTTFAELPPIRHNRANLPSNKPVDLDKAVKAGLVKVAREGVKA